MDSQHLQGEGIPPQAGEGQHHRRPDERYLNFQPPPASALPTSPEDKRKWVQETGSRGRDPSDPRQPASGPLYHQVLLKSEPGVIQRRAARTCLEPKTPVGWEGREWGGGGQRQNGTVAATLPCSPFCSISSCSTQISHQRAFIDPDRRLWGFSWREWRRGAWGGRPEQCQAYLVQGEKSSSSRSCCLNVFTFLSVNMEDLYRAF